MVDANQGMGMTARGMTAATTAAASPLNPLPHTMNDICQLMSVLVLQDTAQNQVRCVPIPTTGSVFVGTSSDLPTCGIPVGGWYLDALLLIDEYILLIFHSVV